MIPARWLQPLRNTLLTQAASRRRRRKPAAPAAIEALETRILLSFDPTPQEQEMLERINAMRAQPGGTLDQFFSNVPNDPYLLYNNSGLGLTNLPGAPPLQSNDPGIQAATNFFQVDRDTLWFGPNGTGGGFFGEFGMKPVAWDTGLYTAARDHSANMIAADLQSHILSGEPDPTGRAAANGYFGTVTENIFASAESVAHAHAAFAVDWGNGPGGIQNPASHRKNILDDKAQVVGIGIIPGSGATVGPLSVTEDFGAGGASVVPKLLGVVYQDANSDGRYEAGEGLAGVTITVTQTDPLTNVTTVVGTTSTMTAGGYQLDLQPGNYTVTASGGGLPQQQLKTVTIGTPSVLFQNQNEKVDFSTTSLAVATSVSRWIVTGADAGGGPHVKVLDARYQASKFEFMAYEPNFYGGVRVATGDVDGDGTPDIITAPGPGRAPEVKVFSGVDAHLMYSFMAYDPSFTGGVNIAVADITTATKTSSSNAFNPNNPFGIDPVGLTPDGKAEIITAPGVGGPPLVRIFDLNRSLNFNLPLDTPVVDFYAYDPNFRGGVNLAVADVDGALNPTTGFFSGLAAGVRRPEIITAPGPGQVGQVNVFNIIPTTTTIAGSNNNNPTFFTNIGTQLYRTFRPYGDTWTGGVYLAAADLDRDGRADIITGAGPGGGPHVKVFTGANNTLLLSFMAYDMSFHGGVRVAAGLIDGDNIPDLITAAGPGGGPHVKAFTPITTTPLWSFMAYGSFTGGVFVAGGSLIRPPSAASAFTGTPIAASAYESTPRSTTPTDSGDATANDATDPQTDSQTTTGLSLFATVINPGVPEPVGQTTTSTAPPATTGDDSGEPLPAANTGTDGPANTDDLDLAFTGDLLQRLLLRV